MKTLSLETTKLLDKLYNLRGKDSVILVEMDKQKDAAEETLERTTKQKSELQVKIENLQNEHSDLDSQGEKLIEVLSGINKEEYSTVLNSLKIDFDPEEIAKKVEKTLPATIEKIVSEVNSCENELKNVEDEMESAITTIDELAIRKDTALANQEKLNEYFDLSLTGKINITRDSITSLLEQFAFNEEEQREAAKILMFPEDSLFIYDNKVSNNDVVGKSISDVIAEAKDAIETEEEIEAPFVENNEVEPIEEVVDVIEEKNDVETVENVLEAEEDLDNYLVENIGVEDETEDLSLEDFASPIFEIDDEITVFDDEEKEEETEIEDFSTVSISDDMIVTANENEVEEVLNELGIDYLDFTSQDLDELKENMDKDLFVKNVKIMNDNKIDLDIFTDHASLLYDKELEEKINVLLNIGKEPIDIYLNPSILVKYTTEKLNNAIALLASNGMDPKNVPLMAY